MRNGDNIPVTQLKGAMERRRYTFIYIYIKHNDIYSSKQIVGATVLVGFWSLEWAWHICKTNFRCVKSSNETSAA